MTLGGDGIIGWRRSTSLLPVLVLAACLHTLGQNPAQAQLFSDRPPPVPPASVPDPGGAVSLAPPSGPGAGPPSLPPTLMQPNTPSMPPPAVSTVPAAPPLNAAVPHTRPPRRIQRNPPGRPPPAPAPGRAPPPLNAAVPGQGVLSLSAKYGKDTPPINSGLVWRVFADRPDENGTFRLIKEDRSATPNIVLPPGNYVVHVAFGLVSAVRTVSLKAETDRESFVLPAGGLRIEGRVGTSRIPQNQISFAIYKGSQFESGERASLVPNVAAGDVVLLPEGTYYIISNYGDANSVVRSDIRVQASKLTDVTITHRAAVITLKLVSDRGGEALANTAWSVLTP